MGNERSHSVSQVRVPQVGKVDVVRQEVPLFPLAPGEVRLRPLYLGVCGSDLHVFHGEHPVGKPPVVLGHEMCAEVVEVEPNTTRPRVGDIGIVDPILACGECSNCRGNRPNLCVPPVVAGFRGPGFGRTSIVVPASNVHVAPAGTNPRDLVLAEPAACASHCVQRMSPAHAENVLLIGAGTIGLSIVQALRITAAGRVTVIEPDPVKRALAIDLGADEALDVGELPPGQAFSAVIDAVANQNTLDQAIASVRPGGRVIVMGVPSSRLTIDAASVQRFERDIIGSGMYTPQDFDRAVEWISTGAFRTASLITDVYPLDEAYDAVRRAEESTSIKVLIHLASERVESVR